MPVGQIEDDTAQIPYSGKELLINTDLLVENIHFSDRTTSAEDVGWRAIAANFSDLAASGVDEILGITIGLVAPPQTTWKWIDGLYTGMSLALNEYGGKILGGDCSSGYQKLISITALGTLGPLRLHRANAKPGDLIVVSGPHGLSRLGLALLLSDPRIATTKLTNPLKKEAIRAHQRPSPALAALKTLNRCKPPGVQWRAGGTDSSDGLLEAIENLCESSECQAELNPLTLPKSQDWPLGRDWDMWCLNGGEDFELILSIPPNWAKALIKELPSSQIIGIMKSGKPKVVWNNGKEIKETKEISRFKHFSN